MRLSARAIDLPSDVLQRHVGKRKTRSAKHKAAEEGPIHPARHPQQWIEVADRVQATQPPGQAGGAVAAKHVQRVQDRAVADQVEYRIDLLCVCNMLREIAAFDLASLGAQLFQHREALAITGRRDHANSRIHRHLERGLAEVSALGRHLHQIARELREGQGVDLGLSVELAAVVPTVEELRQSLREVVKVNRISWESADAQAS